MPTMAPQTTGETQRDIALREYIEGRLTVDEYIRFIQRQNPWVDQYREYGITHAGATERLSRFFKKLTASIKA